MLVSAFKASLTTNLMVIELNKNVSDRIGCSERNKTTPLHEREYRYLSHNVTFYSLALHETLCPCSRHGEKCDDELLLYRKHACLQTPSPEGAITRHESMTHEPVGLADGQTRR